MTALRNDEYRINESDLALFKRCPACGSDTFTIAHRDYQTDIQSCLADSDSKF